MEGQFKARLLVNGKPIDINPFVEEFLARTTVAAAASLKGAENIRSLEIHQRKGTVELTVNGKEIPLTPFPNDVISRMLTGIVSSLKGVGDIESIDVNVETE